MTCELKFKIYTLGCKVNQYDANRQACLLSRAGLIMVKNKADLAIINSCAVTKTAIVKSTRMINKAKKENPGAKIILTGCWPKAYKARAEEVGVDEICAADNLDRVIKKISNLKFLISKQIQNSKFKTNAINKINPSGNRSRYFLKIQDGCEQFCTYCIIPYTRGKLWSRPEREIMAEVKSAITAGYREIVLCGIHLGLYGMNVKAQMSNVKINLTNILKKLVKINGLGRIRLSSIEVNEVSSHLIKLMANSRKICRHLHIPLQSGSDKILKPMNRPYSVNKFKNKIREIRKKIPDIALTTDVMVGFPGETEKDYNQTYNLIREIKFSRLHVFPFSAHEKTPAAKMLEQIDEKTKKIRADKLRKLGRILSEKYKRKFQGRELAVVVERIIKNKIVGKSEYYFDIEFDSKQIMGGIKPKIGGIVRVKMK